MRQAILAGILVLGLGPMSAHAVIVGSQDWLQPTDTLDDSWNDIATVCDSSTGVCSGTLPDSGVDVTGYIWASNADVDALAQAYNGGIGLASLNTVNFAYSGPDSLETFFSDFAPSFDDPTFQQVFAYTRDQSLGLITADTIIFNRFIGVLDADSDFHQLAVGLGKDFTLGGWFYRNVAVPEPTTLALLALGLLRLGCRRSKQH